MVAAVGTSSRVMPVGSGTTSSSAKSGAVSARGVPISGSASSRLPARTTGSGTRPTTVRSSRTDIAAEAKAAFQIGSPPALPSPRIGVTI